MTQATAPTRATAVDMTHRQILEALSGLLLGCSSRCSPPRSSRTRCRGSSPS